MLMVMGYKSDCLPHYFYCATIVFNVKRHKMILEAFKIYTKSHTHIKGSLQIIHTASYGFGVFLEVRGFGQSFLIKIRSYKREI